MLQKPSDSGPIAEGLRLYRALATTYNVILIADPGKDKDNLEYWLLLHGLTRHSHVHYMESYLEDQLGAFHARVSTFRTLRRAGFMLDIITEPDPALAAKLAEDGWTVLAFLHPSYARPEWRPSFRDAMEVTPWAELEETMIRDALLKTAEGRKEE